MPSMAFGTRNLNYWGPGPFGSFPKAPRSFRVHTCALKELQYHNSGVYVYTIKLHGTFGFMPSGLVEEPLHASFRRLGLRTLRIRSSLTSRIRRPKIEGIHPAGPRGSKYPVFQASSSKSHTLNGVWDQSLCILAYWVLGPYLEPLGTQSQDCDSSSRNSEYVILRYLGRRQASGLK